MAKPRHLPHLAARYRGSCPAVTITGPRPDGLGAPLTPRPRNTADRQLDDEVLERTLLAGLALADAIDAYLGRSDRGDGVCAWPANWRCLPAAWAKAPDQVGPADPQAEPTASTIQLGAKVQECRDVARVPPGPRSPGAGWPASRSRLDRLQLVVVDRRCRPPAVPSRPIDRRSAGQASTVSGQGRAPPSAYSRRRRPCAPNHGDLSGTVAARDLRLTILAPVADDPLLLHLRADHEPGHVGQEQQRNVKGVTGSG